MKIKECPCHKCKYDGEKGCQKRTCSKFEYWFRESWREIRRLFGKGEADE